MPAKPTYAAPVIPNAGVENWYREQLQEYVRLFSQDMLDRINAAWRTGGGIAQDARPRKPTDTLLREAMAAWSKLWTRRMNTASLRLSTLFASKSKRATESAMRQTLAKAGFTVKFTADKLTQQAYRSVVAAQVELIKDLPQHFYKNIATSTFNNVMNGSDLNAIHKELTDKYGIEHRRAALIARDQNHKAKAAIERARRIDVGITEAGWMHSHAGKDWRPTHAANDGKDYNIKTGWYDPAVKKNIWPGTEINCRCNDRAKVPGFD